ncbi:hypothetical protein, partial [Pseudomonas helleri]|uniref:hypothetical protein n=1 Tax=Pseudomonas helleri TaxID=1608996 RepID=UPI003FD6A85C
VSSLAFEFSGKDTTLLGHLTPRYGEHSRLNECPVSLDHYSSVSVKLDYHRHISAYRYDCVRNACLHPALPIRPPASPCGG